MKAMFQDYRFAIAAVFVFGIPILFVLYLEGLFP
jgi:hypothetical protein